MYEQFAVYHTKTLIDIKWNPLVEPDSVPGRPLFAVYFTTLFYLARNIPPDSSAAAPEESGAQPEGMKAVSTAHLRWHTPADHDNCTRNMRISPLGADDVCRCLKAHCLWQSRL